MIPIYFALLLLLGAFLFIFLMNLIIEGRLKRKLSEMERPIAISWLKSGVFLCVGLMFQGILQSTLTTESVLKQTGDIGLPYVLAYFALYLGIAVLTFIILFLLCALLFSSISKGKGVFTETANDNRTDVLLFLGILLGVTVAVNEGLPLIYELFIPYPSIPQLF